MLKMSTAAASTTESTLKKEFFFLLDSAIRAINPTTLIEKNIQIESHDQKEYLTISRDLIFPNSLPPNIKDTKSTANNHKHSFLLNQNVYVLAFGKAALGIL